MDQAKRQEFLTRLFFVTLQQKIDNNTNLELKEVLKSRSLSEAEILLDKELTKSAGSPRPSSRLSAVACPRCHFQRGGLSDSGEIICGKCSNPATEIPSIKISDADVLSSDRICNMCPVKTPKEIFVKFDNCSKTHNLTCLECKWLL
jgi:hypothetical protein